MTTGGRQVTGEEEVELRRELATLREEHSDLDAAISALIETEPADTIPLQRLKKKKLALKDRISGIEDRLLPDIIA
ncbi:MAG: YdcH family protein [Alphaproteobacteria bacterium]